MSMGCSDEKQVNSKFILQVAQPVNPGCSCERSTSDGFWSTASPRAPTTKTPSAMAAFTAAAAVAVLADSAAKQRTLPR
jgi:hypothetical protein